MWDHMDGYSNQYCCASAIYLFSCLALEFSIIIYIAVGAPVHIKYLVNGINYIDKIMINLSMANLINNELI